ncbi:MAG: hypothetical protein KME23_06010 [Goleter apudmare HA4340-LM2]|jgi:hypothetical protein|nr:hypothetical protein [Goleter apudmare HA4340-LM2]
MSVKNQGAIELSNKQLDVVAGGTDASGYIRPSQSIPQFELPNLPAIAFPPFPLFPG